MKKKKPIGYSKERVVLSDTLPYELPIIFSNRHFYRFLTNFGVNFIADKSNIQWNKAYKDQSISAVVKLLFGLEEDVLGCSIKISDRGHIRIPFKYQITHKENDFRELALPHPKNQLEVISFYEEFKETILYYCNQSSFSIRKPSKIAKFVYSNDALHLRLKGKDDDAIEDNSKEYENLKTYFTYKDYSNIYKFYEDYQYHRAEKKYNQMFKFDISKCFPSIYTHSIVWALFNKEVVKDEILLSKSTFAGKFDKLMQYANFGETNGILVGPEFSRIFAELILQRIDKDIEDELRKENIIFKKDYEVYRYVD
ncbi:MAG: RNA-directed DNA polymerase, partial [Flavobacterium sp.]